MSYNSKYTGAEVEALLDAAGNKQDKIEDLDTIREGALKGATALQSVPSEYVTESELVWVKEDGEAGVRLKGTNGTATGNLAISAGDDKTASDGTLFSSVASGDHAVVFGFGNTCAGRSTLAQGLYNTVNGKDSVAFGQRNLVNGDQAFAAGQQNEVTTRLGVAIGYKNKATNTDSIAIGYQNTSGGSASVAMGDTCEASGTSSTAMGYKTKATGAYSSTFGENTQATNEGEVAMGLYNKSTTSTDASEQTAFSFGIGTSDTDRVNAFEIKKNGEVYIGDKKLSDFATTTELGEKQDKLISGTNIKTINGQSLVGSGDISISGGGSSSGKEYVEAPLMTEPMGTSIMFTSSVPLEPNKVYVANKKVSSIDMSRILIPSDSIGAEYTIMFQTSTSELPISVSNMVQLLWADGATPTIEADTYYELSLVVNRMGNTYDTIIFKVVLTPFKAVEQ